MTDTSDFVDEMQLRENWLNIRRLEHDLEDAMARYHRVTDGLGFAAIAFLLREKGWTHVDGDLMTERVRNNRAHAAKPVLDVEAEARPIIENAIRHWPEITVADVRGRSPSGARDNRRVARRAAYKAMSAAGWPTARIARVFGRANSTVYHAIYGPQPDPVLSGSGG